MLSKPDVKKEATYDAGMDDSIDIVGKVLQRIDCYPKIIMVDFENLEQFDVAEARNFSGIPYIPSPYTLESVITKRLDFFHIKLKNIK